MDDVDAGAGSLGELLRVLQREDADDEEDEERSADDARSEGSAEEAAEDASHGARVSRLAVGLWSLAAALLVAVLVIGVVLVRRDPSDVERRNESLAVSERFAVALASHDYRDLDASFAKVRRLSTGSFLDDFETTFASPELRAALEEAKSVGTAKVVTGPLLADFDGNRSRSFTVVEQRVTTKDAEEPVVRLVRIELILVDTDDGWLVDTVEVT